jgi:hypothetical protein
VLGLGIGTASPAHVQDSRFDDPPLGGPGTPA